MSDDGQPEDETDVAPEEADPPEADGPEPEREAGAEPSEPELADDVPTGLPDETVVAEAGEPVTGSAGEPTDPITGSEGGPDDDGPDPVLAEVTGVRAGVEAMLPDLAATAREETVTTGLAGLQRGLDELVRLTRRADDHVAELHAENQRLRAGEIASATQPMIRDLVRLHDEVTRLAEASHPEARSDLALVGTRLLDTLARWGLTPFTPEAGERLDATRHQGVGRVPSSDGEPGTIATVRRPGFAHDDGRTFRAAEVEVFTSPPPPDPMNTTTEES